MNMDVQISQVPAFNHWGMCLITELFYLFLCHAASPGGGRICLQEMQETDVWPLGRDPRIPSLQEDSLELLFCHSVVCQSLQPTWTAAHWVSLSFTISQSLLKLTSIESAMPSNRLILCRPLLLLPSIFPSIRVFSKESPLHIRWPKYWSFSFGISPSNEYSGLISFSIGWFDLLASKGLSDVFSNSTV